MIQLSTLRTLYILQLLDMSTLRPSQSQFGCVPGVKAILLLCKVPQLDVEYSLVLYNYHFLCRICIPHAILAQGNGQTRYAFMKQHLVLSTVRLRTRAATLKLSNCNARSSHWPQGPVLAAGRGIAHQRFAQHLYNI